MSDELGEDVGAELTTEDLSVRYAREVRALDKIEGLLPKGQVLECLRLRDRIARSFADVTTAVVTVTDVAKADRALRRLDLRLAAVPEVAEWRRSLMVQESAWWWFPDHRLIGRWDAAGLLIGALTLPLILDITGRFGTSGLGLTGAALVLLPPLLIALSSGGALSKAIAAQRDWWLRKAGVPTRRLGIAGVALALLVFLLILGLWRALPWFSGHYSDLGVTALEANRLSVAEGHLRRALRLDPDNAQAHYNLGHLHEELFQTQEAIHEYQVAFAAGLDVAANNLGRLLVLDGRADAAVQVVLPLVRRTQNVGLEPAVRYRLLKNLAWARLEQGRTAEALATLEEALPLEPDSAPAHCLLGRIHTQIGDRARAAQAWDLCLRHAREQNPDEDRWLQEADAFFRKGSP